MNAEDMLLRSKAQQQQQ